MENSPILSIILPVYNGEAFLERAIESVLSQKDISYELILINDGSRDGTDMICTKYCEKYEWIQYIKQENCGLSAARNKGFQYASGKYIAYLDADDYVETDYYSRLVISAEQCGADFIMSGFERDFVRDGCITHTESVHFEDLYLASHEQIRNHYDQVFFYNVYIHVWNKLFKKEFLEKYNICFDESVRFGEDVFFNLENLSHARNIHFLEISGYHYLCHQANRLTTGWREGLIQDNRTIYQKISEFEQTHWHCADSPVAAGMYLRGCFLSIEKAINHKLTYRELKAFIVQILKAKETRQSVAFLLHHNNSLEFTVYRWIVTTQSTWLFYVATQARRQLKRLLRR